MAEAMRQAGIRSPRTAYLWWHRFQEAGQAGLQPRSHARKKQQTIPPEIADAICRLRRARPELGRRSIARKVALSYGPRAVSPTGVEAVLRRTGLWERPQSSLLASAPIAMPLWLNERVDYERLMETIKTGFQLSVQSQPKRAAEVLYREVWQPLERDVDRWNKLLGVPRLGAWLLRSRVQLGHSFMNSGQWGLAARYFGETLQWMSEQQPDTRQRHWEEAGQIISLRWDDVWIESFQYLGIVLRNHDWKAAHAYTHTALERMQRARKPLIPSSPAMLGNLQRDFAKLKLKRDDTLDTEIADHLLRAQEQVGESSAPGMRADAHIAWARLASRQARRAGRADKSMWLHALERMEQELERVISLVAEESSPILRTILFTGAAYLYQAHGLPVNQMQVQEAARYCLTGGYGHQAREMLKLRDLHRLLPSDLYSQVIALAERLSWER